MSSAIERARADVGAGRLWKARDRLVGLLLQRQDDEVLDLLADVYYRMGDLPAAGALWFVTGRDDDSAHVAGAAWRQRYGGPHAQWHSIPPPVRAAVDRHHLAQLRSAARQDAGPGKQLDKDTVLSEGGGWGGTAGCLLLIALVVVLMLVGAFTIAQWILQ
ncbi:hypothetical protein HJ588_04200 [Flexivirga sp. ID2601S]|uniref:Uncharacterized protein n=1 Tax=Flexivirga aerilata TaxID=1656889 RepID=A0A849AFX3_9MICO|nr:DUF6584 family protein [Flexivirga aerilata]NNG38476.1 hypothetical protein [Flexivirga aerilata]